jgi:hypothetical protein
MKEWPREPFVPDASKPALERDTPLDTLSEQIAEAEYLHQRRKYASSQHQLEAKQER